MTEQARSQLSTRHSQLNEVDAVTDRSEKHRNPAGEEMDRNHKHQVAEASAQYLAQTASTATPASHDCPPGYKRTEVGEIPEDWEANQLSEGVTLVSGHHVMAQFCNTDGIGTPYLTGPADFPNGTISVSKFTDRPTSMCAKGDLLITVKGSGAGSLVEADSAYCISRQLMAIKACLWEPKFLKYSVLQNAESIKSAAAGLIPGLSRADILEQVLPIPPVEEQTAIANALSDVDALISELEKLIAKKQAIKTATMQQLLTGRTRLPQFALREDGTPKGYKQSELGEIPEDWEVVPLGLIANIKTGARNNQDKVSDGLYPFFVRSEKIERLDSYSYDCEAILVPGEGGIGNIFHYINGKFDAHQRVYVIRGFQSCIGKYVYFQMRMNFGSHAMENSVKATVDSLRLPTFKNFKLLVPSLEEQTAIATILSDMDEEIQALQQRLAKTRQIKQGMMQELLTGRVRLTSGKLKVESGK